MAKLHIILTGGTIEKAYDPLTEKPEFRYESIVPSYLKNAIKSYSDIEFEVVCQIDSSQMQDDTRAEILAAVQKSKHRGIVIIHGTSTMPETARYLEKHLGENDKAIILTGAMIPLKEFAMSDAGFNMGYAMAQAECAPAGVYIAMNARLFDGESVKKNTDIGRFELIK